MLTLKQKELLTFLIKRIETTGISPSYQEICSKLSLKSKSGIHRIVKGLEERGYIKHLENKARSLFPEKHPNGQKYINDIVLFEKKESFVKKTDIKEIIKIPLLGKIAAGLPIEAIETFDKYINLPSSYVSNGEYYALKVTGDSMIEEGIHENDTIIIDNKKIPKNGDIVVAFIDDEDVTLKRFRKKGDSIALEPANKNYKTYIYGPDRIKIQGVLTSLIRLY